SGSIRPAALAPVALLRDDHLPATSILSGSTSVVAEADMPPEPMAAPKIPPRLARPLLRSEAPCAQVRSCFGRGCSQGRGRARSSQGEGGKAQFGRQHRTDGAAGILDRQRTITLHGQERN